MVILNYPSWIRDNVTLGHGHKKKDEQGWNAKSSGMKMTTTDNAWLGWTKRESRKKDLGFVT